MSCASSNIGLKENAGDRRDSFFGSSPEQMGHIFVQHIGKDRQPSSPRGTETLHMPFVCAWVTLIGAVSSWKMRAVKG